jgi:hypothetical protein
MATFNEMVDEVSLHLSGYGMRNEALTHITGAINTTATQLTVGSAESVGKGLIEIDDELMWVDSFDRTANTVTIAPYGRGYNGSTAAAHTANTKVVINPVFTRKAIKTAINDTIQAVASQLYGIGSTSFTSSVAVTTYALPANLDSIISVSFEAIGPTKEWVPVRGYRLDKAANVTEFGSPNTITINSFIDPSSTVQVTYTFDPEPMESNSDDFEATTGLPASAKDVIILGAAYRLLSFVDPGRLNYMSAEANSQGQTVPYGSGTNTAKYVYALFTQRLKEESDKLLAKFPVRVHYTN